MLVNTETALEAKKKMGVQNSAVSKDAVGSHTQEAIAGAYPL